MSIEVKVPTLPESIANAVIAKWYKKSGDSVRQDENLVDLETDKVMLEVPAPADGVIEEILIAEGETVVPQQVLAKIQAGAVVKSKPEIEKTETKKPAPAEKTANATLTPAVRRTVAEHDLDVSKISGSGKAGRVLKQDVAAALIGQDGAGLREEKRVPMSRMRARIAERLLAAKNETAMLTTFNEVNMQAIMDLRVKYKDSFEKQFGVRLGFMAFFVKAAIEALKFQPTVNASIDGDDIVYHGYFDIGIAVSTDRGLVVPVLRDADQMTIAEIEAEILRYAQKARDGKLTLEEMTGGTFTITNGGVFGSMLSTPILNPPQAAILGMHNIVKRAVVENDEIKIRPMMYLAMSYDHRIIDGRQSVTFLVKIKELLEDPARFLLNI